MQFRGEALHSPSPYSQSNASCVCRTRVREGLTSVISSVYIAGEKSSARSVYIADLLLITPIIVTSSCLWSAGMECLFCGKTVGPLRELIDSDFCCEAHRKRYHQVVKRNLDHVLQFEVP